MPLDPSAGMHGGLLPQQLQGAWCMRSLPLMAAAVAACFGLGCVHARSATAPQLNMMWTAGGCLLGCISHLPAPVGGQDMALSSMHSHADRIALHIGDVACCAFTSSWAYSRRTVHSLLRAACSQPSSGVSSGTVPYVSWAACHGLHCWWLPGRLAGSGGCQLLHGMHLRVRHWQQCFLALGQISCMCWL